MAPAFAAQKSEDQLMVAELPQLDEDPGLSEKLDDPGEA